MLSRYARPWRGSRKDPRNIPRGQACWSYRPGPLQWLRIAKETLTMYLGHRSTFRPQNAAEGPAEGQGYSRSWREVLQLLNPLAMNPNKQAGQG